MRLHELMSGGGGAPLMPFAPPILHAGELWISHTAAITSFVAERHGLAPSFEQERLTARTIALTIADLATEAHDTHHPISSELHYEKQSAPAKLRAEAFRTARMPKFLRHLERTISRNDRHSGGAGVLVGTDITYVDLEAFQIVEGLKYAYPRAFARLIPRAAARDGAAQPRRRAPSPRELSRLGAQAAIQRAGSVPPLSRARWMTGTPGPHG